MRISKPFEQLFATCFVSSFLIGFVPVMGYDECCCYEEESCCCYEEEPCCYDDGCQVFDVSSTLGLRYTDGRGVGWEEGYLTLEGMFFPVRCGPNFWPFLDIRVHYLLDNEWAANAGIGFRYVPDCSRLFIGLNAYFDYRSSDDLKSHFTQVGVGFELLGDCWEFRLNGYIPIDTERTTQKCRFFYPGGFFIFRDQFKEAYQGLEAEVGRYFWRDCNFSLYAGVGPYYYGQNLNGRVLGGRFRVEMEVCDWLYVGGGVTYDKVFNTRGYGFIGIRFPFGGNPCCCETFCERRMRQRVYRNDLIVLDEACCWKSNF